MSNIINLDDYRESKSPTAWTNDFVVSDSGLDIFATLPEGEIITGLASRGDCLYATTESGNAYEISSDGEVIKIECV